MYKNIRYFGFITTKTIIKVLECINIEIYQYLMLIIIMEVI